MLVALGFFGGFALFLAVAPRGTPVDDDTVFSTSERVRSLAAAGVLAGFALFLRNVVGLEEKSDAGKVIFGIVTIPILLLLWIVVIGRASNDPD